LAAIKKQFSTSFFAKLLNTSNFYCQWTQLLSCLYESTHSNLKCSAIGVCIFLVKNISTCFFVGFFSIFFFSMTNFITALMRCLRLTVLCSYFTSSQTKCIQVFHVTAMTAWLFYVFFYTFHFHSSYIFNFAGHIYKFILSFAYMINDY